jgi:hypothetical protein
MNWSDVIKPPPEKMLRQFAGLCIVVFVGLAGWRAWQGHAGTITWALAAVGGIVGVIGLISPSAIRPIYTGGMIAAFTIGWTVSRIVLGAVYYLVFTPVALVFRLMRRDVLHLQRPQQTTYWSAKAGADKPEAYFRQF